MDYKDARTKIIKKKHTSTNAVTANLLELYYISKSNVAYDLGANAYTRLKKVKKFLNLSHLTSI